VKKRSRQRRAWFDTRFGGAEALLTMTQAEMASKDDRHPEPARAARRVEGCAAFIQLPQ
jgi:hypothetical protein